jgi:hypothetical protein
MVALSWRTPARISVSGPDGWFPVERVEVHHVEQEARVAVESWPGAEDEREFAARYVAARLAPIGWHQLAEEAVTALDGVPAYRLRGTTGAGAIELTVDFCTETGRTTVITSARSGPDATVATEAAAIAASVRMASYFDGDAETVLSADPGQRPAVVEPVEVCLTFEEALAVAAQHDVPTLPGVDPRYLSGLAASARELVLQVARRSVQARDADGTGPVSTALALAARHEALLTVQRPGAQPQWVALGQGALVQIARDLAAGTLSLRLRPIGELPDRLLGTVSGVAAPTADSGGAIQCDPDHLAAVLAGADGPPELSRLRGAEAATVRGVRREAGAIVGGEVEWVRAGSARWSVERSGGAPITLLPTDRAALVARLAELLPPALREPAGVVGEVPA